MASRSTSENTLKILSFIIRLMLNIIFYIAIIYLIARISQITYNFTYQIFGQVTSEEAPGTDVVIQIKKGESTMNIASKLERNKVIVNKYSFYVKAKLKKYVIMPGTYTVNTSMTYDEIFTAITVPSADETGEPAE